MNLKIFGFSLFFFCLASCAPPPVASPTAPDCPPEGQPSKALLEEKKQQLFEDIEDSNRYSSSQIKEKALKRYKNQIKIKERTACPKDLERFINSISSLHRNT